MHSPKEETNIDQSSSPKQEKFKHSTQNQRTSQCCTFPPFLTTQSTKRLHRQSSSLEFSSFSFGLRPTSIALNEKSTPYLGVVLPPFSVCETINSIYAQGWENKFRLKKQEKEIIKVHFLFARNWFFSHSEKRKNSNMEGCLIFSAEKVLVWFGDGKGRVFFLDFLRRGWTWMKRKKLIFWRKINWRTLIPYTKLSILVRPFDFTYFSFYRASVFGKMAHCWVSLIFRICYNVVELTVQYTFRLIGFKISVHNFFFDTFTNN